jgi:hypothetical protein
MTRDEALHLLEEHRGNEVVAELEIVVGDLVSGMLTLSGVLTPLRHPEGQSPAEPTAPGEPPSDFYSIGDGTLYLPADGIGEIRDSVAGPGVEVALSANASVRISWSTPLPSRRGLAGGRP